MSETNAKPWKPYSRWESFHTYNNRDGTFHILVIEGGGGRHFCDQLENREEAEWAAALLNAAIGAGIPPSSN
jgi:hypothetical protein